LICHIDLDQGRMPRKHGMIAEEAIPDKALSTPPVPP